MNWRNKKELIHITLITAFIYGLVDFGFSIISVNEKPDVYNVTNIINVTYINNIQENALHKQPPVE